MTEDFTSFRFGIYDSERLGLTVVSSSNYYDPNLLPAPTDVTIDVPGGPGQYYLGSYYKNREFKVSVAFDNVSEQQWRQMAQIFATDSLQDLVFNQNPYKTYKAKLKSKPEFKYVCFRDPETQKRIYKGTGTLTFIAYHPYAFCYNKYVVRAADYYKCINPCDIINSRGYVASQSNTIADTTIEPNSININPYSKRKPPSFITGLIKDHQNKKPNMNETWKGGYPSIGQVQWGELYFNVDDNSEKKMIIDVRHYWDNVPQWEETAQLLYTPTLDYERNLIYMPQYSTTNYYNMDTGLNRQNALIGSRLLVYNPGDIEIPFELKLGNLTSKFRKHTSTERFRVSRYNVQRLSIEQAVDWTGLRTRDKDDNAPFKYGTRYVSIIEANGNDSSNPVAPSFRKLKNSHPEYIYVAEPIPRDRLGHFIRVFYWQSSNLDDKVTAEICPWEKGKELANRYEEMLELCLTEDEKNELYWHTLNNHILEKYKELNDKLTNKIFSEDEDNNNYTFEDFKYDFIYNPPEYFRNYSKTEDGTTTDLDYDEFVFNLGRLPTFITEDYLEITDENFGNLNTTINYNNTNVESLFLDFDSRMLYNIHDVKNSDLNYGITKGIYTDNVKKGKWFLLPPGWSLIDITPVVDESIWGGKRWLDARPFNWGTTSESDRETFNKYEKLAIIEYISQVSPKCNLQRTDIIDMASNPFISATDFSAAAIKEELSTWNLNQLEDLIQFRRWYDSDSAYQNYADWRTKAGGTAGTLGYEIWRNRIEQAEYGFLKTLADIWRVNHTDNNGLPLDGQDIDIWWWNANNYSWNNFPPLYWGYLDLLNQAQIKYTPQFY